MGRYGSAAFTRTSLTSYLLKRILQRRGTYVSAKSLNLHVRTIEKKAAFFVTVVFLCLLLVS